MRTSLTQTDEAPARSRLALPAFGPAMTRCECAGISFAEIGRLLDAGEPLPAALARTGCGSTCTACRPDLESYLAGRSSPD
jgi:bacterioferritin-associated ferredoxin